MNGTLAQNVARQLYPALEQSQGYTGIYSRGAHSTNLRGVPSTPDWSAVDDTGVVEEWLGMVFIVSADEWSRTELGVPELNDRFVVTLADGIERHYALLPPKGLRPYDMPAGGHGYSLRMKLVKQ